MRIIIVSDTHGTQTNLERVLEAEPKRDLLIHLGDVEGAEDYIRVIAECPCEIVAGNNDFGWDLPMEQILNIGGKRILLTHGACYMVSSGNRRLLQIAAEKNVDIVMFGHTHRPIVEKYYITAKGEMMSDVSRPEKEFGGREVTLINPGSLTYPRQKGRKPSYVVMTGGETGGSGFQYEILYLNCNEQEYIY